MVRLRRGLTMGNVLKPHGCFEGGQIVAADGKDEVVGGFYGKETAAAGEDAFDMVFIDEGCAMDTQEDRRV